MKACKTCGKIQPLDEFFMDYKPTQRRKKVCKRCTAKAQRERYKADEKFKSERREHCAVYMKGVGKEVKSHARRKRKYGMEPHEFLAMLTAQGGLCAICRTDKPSGNSHGPMMVDHCHKTGKIRGLLCHHCNAALGHAQDNPATLRAMADYLERTA